MYEVVIGLNEPQLEKTYQLTGAPIADLNQSAHLRFRCTHEETTTLVCPNALGEYSDQPFANAQADLIVR